MKSLDNSKGITLMALVVTIIILLILAGITIGTLTGDNGILSTAQKSKITTELSQIKVEIEQAEAKGELKKENKSYMTVEEVNDEITMVQGEYKGKIGLYREQLVYLGEETDEIAQIAKECGYEIINMTEDEFSYYVEMGILEDSVKISKSLKIGRELSTQELKGTIKIGDNTYSNGWYIIGNYTTDEKSNNTYSSQFEDLKLKDTTHAPYLVNYETGSIYSIDGMIMYKAEIPVHTFQNNNSRLVNAITYVDDVAKKTGEYYGNLYSTKLYTGPVNVGANYSDNNGELQYDKDGALILDQNNAIPVLDVNQKYKVDDAYTISVTVNGDINQKGNNGEEYFSTIVALSDESNKFISAFGYYKGFLHIYSYKDNSYNTHYGLEEGLAEKGFASIDISKYADQTINIQVASEREKETKVYINGELIKTFESGDEKFTYNYTTIGDLRVGRNLKFKGKIYDFAIYGVALNESDIKLNYENSKKYIEK